MKKPLFSLVVCDSPQDMATISDKVLVLPLLPSPKRPFSFSLAVGLKELNGQLSVFWKPVTKA